MDSLSRFEEKEREREVKAKYKGISRLEIWSPDLGHNSNPFFTSSGGRDSSRRLDIRQTGTHGMRKEAIFSYPSICLLVSDFHEKESDGGESNGERTLVCLLFSRFLHRL